MRILYISPVGTVGGAERVLLDLIASTTGHQTNALLMNDGPLADRLRAVGCDVAVLPLPDSIGSLGDSEAMDGGKAGLIWRSILAAPGLWLYLRRLRRAVRRIA